MRAPLHSLIFAALAALCLAATSLHAQRVRGELRIEVHDSAGATVPPDPELLSEANQLHRTFKIAQDGRYTAQDLPFGVYRLNINAEGFAPWSNLVDIPSEVPMRIPVTLGVAPVATPIQVTGPAPLVDPSRATQIERPHPRPPLDPSPPGPIYSLGRQTTDQQMSPQPGRNLSDLVNQQP